MGEKINGELWGVIQYEGMTFFGIPGEPVDLALGNSSAYFGWAATELSQLTGVVFESV